METPMAKFSLKPNPTPMLEPDIDPEALEAFAAVECSCLGLFGATRPLTHDPQLFAIEGESMELIESGHVLSRLALLGAPGFAEPSMPTPHGEGLT